MFKQQFRKHLQAAVCRKTRETKGHQMSRQGGSKGLWNGHSCAAQRKDQKVTLTSLIDLSRRSQGTLRPELTCLWLKTVTPLGVYLSDLLAPYILNNVYIIRVELSRVEETRKVNQIYYIILAYNLLSILSFCIIPCTIFQQIIKIMSYVYTLNNVYIKHT